MPVNFRSENFSKPSASTSLLRMARLPSRVKVISLSGPSMRSWIQPFCAPFEYVQEFDAERLAIGAAQDADDLAHGAEFESEHLVEEDRAIEIGVGEAVGARIELFLVLRRLKPERIEIGVEMAARAIGADQHQRADRVARGAFDVGRGDVDAARLRLRLDLGAERLAGFRPVAVERGDEIAALRQRPVRPLPGRAARVFLDVARRRPSGFGRTTAIRHRPISGRPRSGRRGRRYRRHCRRRGTR